MMCATSVLRTGSVRGVGAGGNGLPPDSAGAFPWTLDPQMGTGTHMAASLAFLCTFTSLARGAALRARSRQRHMCSLGLCSIAHRGQALIWGGLGVLTNGARGGFVTTNLSNKGLVCSISPCPSSMPRRILWPYAGHKALHTCTSWCAYAATLGSSITTGRSH